MPPVSITAELESRRPHRKLHLRQAICIGAGFLFLAAFAPEPSPAQQQQGASQASPALINPLPHPTSVILPAANPIPDANDRMEMQQQRLKRANFDAANAERKRQLDADSTQLLKLAAELKAEIDKTPQDMLSLSVVRKAEEIERLAHNVQTKMKLTVGAD